MEYHKGKRPSRRDGDLASDRAHLALRTARELISQGSLKEAAEIIERTLEVEDRDDLRTLLDKISRRIQLLDRGACWQVDKEEMEARTILVEVDTSPDSLPTEEDQRTEAVLRPRLEQESAARQETRTQQREELPSPAAMPSQQEDFVRGELDEEPGDWLLWRQVVEESSADSLCFQLLFCNRRHREIRLTKTNIRNLVDRLRAGQTTYPRRNIAVDEHCEFQFLRLSSGRHSYRVQVTTVEGTTRKNLSATLKISVSHRKPIKLVDIKCR